AFPLANQLMEFTSFSPLPSQGIVGLGISETPPSTLDKGLWSYFQYHFASHYAKSLPDTTGI
ncbi:MAG: hypothetical protein WA228_01215, partial [Desulfobaccales bacterium]